MQKPTPTLAATEPYEPQFFGNDIILAPITSTLNPSATTMISEGPAIKSIPTFPNTCFFADAT